HLTFETPKSPTLILEKTVPPTEFNWKGKYFKSIVDAAAQATNEGDLMSAAGLFAEAATKAPEKAKEFSQKAMELLETLVEAKVRSQPELAIETATKALTLAPNSWRLYEMKGCANLRLERYEEAAVQFDLAAVKSPTQAKRLRVAAANS